MNGQPPAGYGQVPPQPPTGYGQTPPQPSAGQTLDSQDNWWRNEGSGIPGQDMDFFRDQETDGEQENGGETGEEKGTENPSGPVGRFSNTAFPSGDADRKQK